ncbi:MAG TPA: hypothetical protein DGG95_04230, partial [Cytophagales bacterium]|nr:hypothetical protein [Cytophagales bacterium]
NKAYFLKRSPLGSLSLTPKNATVRPRQPIKIINKVDIKKERPKKEKTTAKRTTKIKPKRIRKVIF